jgi:hypothetical protein
VDIAAGFVCSLAAGRPTVFLWDIAAPLAVYCPMEKVAHDSHKSNHALLLFLIISIFR